MTFWKKTIDTEVGEQRTLKLKETTYLRIVTMTVGD